MRRERERERVVSAAGGAVVDRHFEQKLAEKLDWRRETERKIISEQGNVWEV